MSIDATSDYWLHVRQCGQQLYLAMHSIHAGNSWGDYTGKMGPHPCTKRPHLVQAAATSSSKNGRAARRAIRDAACTLRSRSSSPSDL
ncbi:hypothetical protein Dimus_005007, partial [Dionaea muscipula]